jgi:hypothetical protein
VRDVAKPQTEDGFVMIALDLFAAILAADLPNRCMIVLAEVLLQSYGPHKRRDVHLDPPTIEHYSGLHRNNVRRAIAELVAAGILAANADGAYRFVKDYEAWTPRGATLGDRLFGGVLRFVKSAIARFGLPINASKKDPIQPDIASTIAPIQRDCAGAVERNPAGLRRTDVTESNGIVHMVGTRASEEFENRDVREARPHLLSPEDAKLVDEAVALADAWFPMRELGIAISREQHLFNSAAPGAWPATWLRPGLEKLRLRPTRQHTPSYLKGILEGFAKDGAPEIKRPTPTPPPVHRARGPAKS